MFVYDKYLYFQIIMSTVGGIKTEKPMSMFVLGPRPDPRKAHPLAMGRTLLGHGKDPPQP